MAVIVAWALTGPLLGFSDTWQLVVNTGTTIVTFLMVFLIQRAQNKESRAVNLKLNEIVATIQGGQQSADRRRELLGAGNPGSPPALHRVVQLHEIEASGVASCLKEQSGNRLVDRKVWTIL